MALLTIHDSQPRDVAGTDYADYRLNQLVLRAEMRGEVAVWLPAGFRRVSEASKRSGRYGSQASARVEDELNEVFAAPASPPRHHRTQGAQTNQTGRDLRSVPEQGSAAAVFQEL